MIEGEAKASIDNGDGKVDAASIQVGMDQTFANPILPLPTTLHGMVYFLVLMNFLNFSLAIFHPCFFCVELAMMYT